MSRPFGSRNAMPRRDRRRIVRTAETHPAPTPLETPCILWQGTCFPQGYGKKWCEHRQMSIGAHRWVAERIHGFLDTDVDILHRCDNPPCFRYDHLVVGDARMNGLDMMAKGRGKGQFS